VYVSSVGDVGLAELGRTEVVKVDKVVDVNWEEVAEETHEEEPVLVSRLIEGDELDKPEEVALVELTSDAILLEVGLAVVGRREVVEDEVVVVVVVVVDVDEDELDKESCDEEPAVETKLK
jgi:hypothetical protein